MDAQDGVPTVLQPVPTELGQLWERALEASAFERSEVELLLVPADPAGDMWGFQLAPQDSTIDLGPEHGLGIDLLHEIDALRLGSYRIVIFIGEPRLPDYVVLGLMRHELRHAEQHRHDNECYRIGLLAVEAQARDLESAGRGARSLGRCAPHEQDADSAAVGVGEVHVDALDIRDGVFRGLLTEPRGLESLDTLLIRTVAFLALHPEGFAAACAFYRRKFGRDWTPQWVLDQLGVGAFRVFTTVSTDPGVVNLRERVDGAIPTAAEIAAAGRRPADAWSEARRRLEAAQQRAEELAAAAWTDAAAP